MDGQTPSFLFHTPGDRVGLGLAGLHGGVACDPAAMAYALAPGCCEDSVGLLERLYSARLSATDGGSAEASQGAATPPFFFPSPQQLSGAKANPLGASYERSRQVPLDRFSIGAQGARRNRPLFERSRPSLTSRRATLHFVVRETNRRIDALDPAAVADALAPGGCLDSARRQVPTNRRAGFFFSLIPLFLNSRPARFLARGIGSARQSGRCLAQFCARLANARPTYRSGAGATCPGPQTRAAKPATDH